VLARITLPQTCLRGARGLAFDGTFLYYTQRAEPILGTVFRVEAATGADRGSFIVRQDGTAIGVGGLAYDPNRGKLWGLGSGHLWLLSTGTGEIERGFPVFHGGGPAAAYDPWSDTVWESNGGNEGVDCWQSDGYLCGSMGGPTSTGLTFDGIDMWHTTADWLPPPASDTPGYLYPTDFAGNIDWSRLIDPPGTNGYSDIAWDCVTFPVNAIWVANNNACELLAYEVDSRAPCLGLGDHVVRVSVQDPADRFQSLPATRAVAERVWRAKLPLDQRDPGILFDERRPLVFYRFLGPSDKGNVLRARKGDFLIGIDTVVLTTE
jgi:hypothetical protein